jgi:hypothetical protein
MQKQRAQMVVEFALLAPVLILLVLGILGVGRAFYTYVDLTNAARAGARYAIAQTDCTTSAIIAHVQLAQPNLAIPASEINLDCPSDRRTVRITNYSFDTFVPGIGTIGLSTTATLPF